MAQHKPWLKKNNKNEIDVMGAKVQVKKLSFGESRKAIQGAVRYNPVSKQNEVDQTLAGVLRSIAMIEDWDLTDENEEKLPVDFNTFEMLDEEFASELMQKLNAEDDNEVSEEEKK
jgi:hypothetical protein